MQQIRLDGAGHSHGCFLALDVQHEGTDYRIVSTVQYHGFTAHSDAWIVSQQWKRFVDELAAIEATRRGRACLESVSPGELRIDIGATDSLGHMSVRGLIGVRGVLSASLQFGDIEFDPSALLRAVSCLQASLTGEGSSG